MFIVNWGKLSQSPYYDDAISLELQGARRRRVPGDELRWALTSNEGTARACCRPLKQNRPLDAACFYDCQARLADPCFSELPYRNPLVLHEIVGTMNNRYVAACRPRNDLTMQGQMVDFVIVGE